MSAHRWRLPRRRGADGGRGGCLRSARSRRRRGRRCARIRQVTRRCPRKLPRANGDSPAARTQAIAPSTNAQSFWAPAPSNRVHDLRVHADGLRHDPHGDPPFEEGGRAEKVDRLRRDGSRLQALATGHEQQHDATNPRHQAFVAIAQRQGRGHAGIGNGLLLRCRRGPAAFKAPRGRPRSRRAHAICGRPHGTEPSLSAWSPTASWTRRAAELPEPALRAPTACLCRQQLLFDGRRDVERRGHGLPVCPS